MPTYDSNSVIMAYTSGVFSRKETIVAYEKLLIYFMSGTGNSFRVANWAAEAAKGRGMEAEVVPVNRGNPEEEIEDSERLLLGLFMPTHGFTAPWLVIKTALGFPRRTKVRAFVVATRAGCKFGALFTPGISATACFLISFILALKGYKVMGIRGVDMPSNWIAVHPGFSAQSAEAIKARSRPKFERFVASILEGRRAWLSWNVLYEVIWALVLWPISLGYLLIGRIYLPKFFFANANCNGCEICARECPVGAITMVGKENKRPYWSYHCESCMRCMAFCPRSAIEASHAWAAILIWFYGPFAVLLIGGVLWLWPSLNEATLRSFFSILGWFVFYPVVIALYYLFIRVTGWRPLNLVFTYLTFTHYWKRYHEPETRVKDVSRKDSN